MGYKITRDVANETSCCGYKAVTDLHTTQEIESHYSNPVMDNTNVIIGIAVKKYFNKCDAESHATLLTDFP